jgi:signal peptidase I
MPDNFPPTNPVPAGVFSTEPLNTPPISLGSPQPPSHPKPPAPPDKKEEPKDSVRELFETIVFVVVLVLMLKTFLAEAFVIPTGSMAPTLLGYHYKPVCEKCGKENLVNASYEADPQDGQVREDVVRWQCQNCQWWNGRP